MMRRCLQNLAALVLACALDQLSDAMDRAELLL